MLRTLVMIFHVLLAVGLVGLILLQRGKGAEVGTAFGAGASGTVFGARGSASFLTRATGILAFLFFSMSLGLAFLSSRTAEAPKSILEAPAQQTAPAGDTSAPAPEGNSTSTSTPDAATPADGATSEQAPAENTAAPDAQQSQPTPSEESQSTPSDEDGKAPQQ
jgi:preprotein translocase subunit SecG